MEGLLKWSIDAAHGGKMEHQPDPKMMSQLLGAPDDMTLMREELRAAVESKEKDERIGCLEGFEEHVENVDNANNMGTLWEPLLHLVKDDDVDVKIAALGCVSAAVQNNQKAQTDLVATKAGISIILDRVTENNDDVSAKALLALSSAIGHCQPAYEQFIAAKGWEVFSSIFSKHFETGDNRPEKLRSRVLSLLFSIVLLAPNMSVHEEIKRLNLTEKLQYIENTETGIVKEKAENILRTLRENPSHGVRLLAHA